MGIGLIAGAFFAWALCLIVNREKRQLRKEKAMQTIDTAMARRGSRISVGVRDRTPMVNLNIDVRTAGRLAFTLAGVRKKSVEEWEQKTCDHLITALDAGLTQLWESCYGDKPPEDWLFKR